MWIFSWFFAASCQNQGMKAIEDNSPQVWKVVETIIATALAIFLFLYFYRSFLLTNFNGVFGDLGDARILIAILEHWYAWISGSESSWQNPIYFFPARDTIGLTDAYFLYGLIYSGFRAIGLDMFRAFMAQMLLVTVIGFSSFLALARLVWNTSFLAAMTGATLFAFGNMVAVKIGHAQVACTMLLPPVVLLVWFAASISPLWGTITSGIAGVIFALIFFTAYQTGWFATTFGVAAVAIYLALGNLGCLRLAFLRQRHIAAAVTLGLCVGMVPFMAAYLPMWRAGKTYDFGSVLYSLPRFTDIINTGESNLAWGAILKSAGIAARPGRPLIEVELGYTPLVFSLVCIATLVCAIRRYNRVSGPREELALTLGLTLIGYWLIELRYFGFPPWWLVYYLVPGGIGIRTTFRSQLVNNLPACMLVVFALEQLARPALRRVGPIGMMVLAGLLVFEQINRKAPLHFWRSDQIKWLATIPPPPTNCRAFYLTPRQNSDHSWWIYQSDAMIVSAFLRLPTLNGNASQWPNGWHLNDPADLRYNGLLHAWIDRNAMSESLCGLSLDPPKWSPGKPSN